MEQHANLCDLGFLYKFTKDDPAKVATYIRTYLRTSERIFKELGETARSGNSDDLYVKAHTVKPQVQYMGITSLHNVILKIEELTKSNPQSGEMMNLVGDALDIYEKSAEELRNHLATLES